MEEIETEEEPEVEVELTSRSDYISCAFNAIQAVDCLNDMTSEDAKRKKRIIRKSIKIIDTIIAEMYDELFEEDEDL